MVHALLAEYIPFIVLLTALFTVAGGIQEPAGRRPEAPKGLNREGHHGREPSVGNCRVPRKLGGLPCGSRGPIPVGSRTNMTHRPRMPKRNVGVMANSAAAAASGPIQAHDVTVDELLEEENCKAIETETQTL